MSVSSPERSNQSVAERIAEAFQRHGVTVVFGQSIPTAFHLAAPNYGIKQAAYRAENAGGIMADGYARITNRVSVVTAQNGPAATLLVPPLAEALKASTPVVALVQEVPAAQAGKNAFQEFDHFRLFDSVAKWVGRIDRPERVDELRRYGVHRSPPRADPARWCFWRRPTCSICRLARGPRRDATLGAFPLDRSVADPERISEAAELLSSAKSPLVVAGGGVHLSGAAAALARLQEVCALPVATTVMGKGSVDETHPLSLGVIGYFMGPGSRTQDMRPLVENADVILFVGARTNQNGTDSWSLFPSRARYIHIDVDSAEVGRNYEALRLVGDARLTLEALATKMQGHRSFARAANLTQPSPRRSPMRSANGERRFSRISTENKRPIRPERLMADIDRLMTPETIVVADASYSSIWIANYLTCRAAGQRFLTPRGLAGLGWGLPLAIGAQFARAVLAGHLRER